MAVVGLVGIGCWVTYVVELVTEDVDGFAVVGDDVETGVVC